MNIYFELPYNKDDVMGQYLWYKGKKIGVITSVEKHKEKLIIHAEVDIIDLSEYDETNVIVD